MKTRKISNKVIIAIIAVLAIVTIFIYLSYLCHKDFEKTAILQTQRQLLMIAKTTANRMEEFVDTLSRESKVIAAEPAVQKEIKDRIMQTQLHVCPIKIFYESHKDNVDALTTLDANGIILHRHPFWVDEKDRIGTDFNDKPGVAYVVREHEPYVSEVFYNNLGELAISISEPVFHENEFIGMVRWMISLDNLSKHFIQPIKAGKAGFAWLLDEGGTMLSYPDPKQVGKHIMAPRKEKFPGHDWSLLEEIVKKSTQGEEDTGIYSCATYGKRVIAYAPVHIGNRLWSIGVSMNYSEIATPIFEHAMHHVEITALVMLLFSAGGFAFYRMERKRADELESKNKELKREITERRRVEEALRESTRRTQIAYDQAITYAHHLNEEITERGRAEDALRESEDKLKGIVDSVTDFMFMVDEQFNIVWTNDVAEDLFGQDMVGKKCHAVYHGRDKVCELCIVRQCFQDGKVHEFETEMATPDWNQRSFWCTASVAALYDDGRPRMVVEFLRDMTERKQSEKEVSTLKQQIEFILGATKTGIDIIDSEFNVRYIDPEWGKVYGDPTGRKCYEYFMGLSEMCPGCGIPKALETKVATVTEEVLVKEGNRPIQVITRPFQNEEGEWLVAEVNVDITERKQAEEKIRTSLREKEVLLREIHHRVKNNMQVISSLLKLQSKYIKDEKDIEMFRESQNRIKSMALVHEKLYQSEDLANIDFNEYVKHLANILFRSYGIDTGKIALKIDVEDVIIEIDIAIPCGLIVNELVSNSLKYAFPEGGKGEVKITLHSTDENEMELTVSDDGVGVPKDLDFSNTESLGLKLVNILTNQIRGRLDLERSKGSKFHIRFKR
jgi:PAS domain S-box-containing protein